MKKKLAWCIVLITLFCWAEINALEPELVSVHCNRFMGNEVRCEARAVHPFIPEWRVYTDERPRAPTKIGVRVFLPLTDTFQTIEMRLKDHSENGITITFQGAVIGGTPYFRKETQNESNKHKERTTGSGG